MRCGRQSVRDRQMNCDSSPRGDFLPRRGQWMHTTGDGCATSGKCTPRFSAALRFFAAPRFPAVSRSADAPLHVKIMFNASLYHRCADRFANAPFRKGERPLSMRRPPATKMRLSRAKTRSPQSDGRHPAATSSERKMTAAAKGDPVPRAARSAAAFASLTSTPTRSGRIQISNTSAKSQRKTRQRRTRRQAHGKKLRHAVHPCEEPPSEAATQTVLRTVCAPARAFSDGTERWCGCRAKSHRGGILRATDAAQRRFSVAGITRTVCHNHTILWGK